MGTYRSDRKLRKLARKAGGPAVAPDVALGGDHE